MDSHFCRLCKWRTCLWTTHQLRECRRNSTWLWTLPPLSFMLSFFHSFALEARVSGWLEIACVCAIKVTAAREPRSASSRAFWLFVGPTLLRYCIDLTTRSLLSLSAAPSHHSITCTVHLRRKCPHLAQKKRRQRIQASSHADLIAAGSVYIQRDASDSYHFLFPLFSSTPHPSISIFTNHNSLHPPSYPFGLHLFCIYSHSSIVLHIIYSAKVVASTKSSVS